RRPRQEVRRAGGAEQAARGAAAEARAHVGALAVLEQHQADDGQRHQHVKHDQYVRPEAHFAAAFTISRKSFATSDAPPIRPPSTSGMAKIAAAFCGLTLPPYRIEVSTGTLFLRNACTACACSGVAFRP